jgi:hypothetical protein
MEGESAHYHQLAREYLERCDEMLDECHLILDSVEGFLETTPKPSERLGW